MAFLELRKFNFFDLRDNVDEGKVAEVLQDTTIEVCTSGYSFLVIGDSKGWIHMFLRTWKVTSFKAYEHCILHAVQLKHDPLLITIGEDETGIKNVIKVWDGSRQDNHGTPVCLRVTKLSRIKASSTALTVHENKNLMAVGFDDGSIILFRGNIARQKSSKEIELRNNPIDNTPITGLAFKGTTHLFVTSRALVIIFNISHSGKEKGTIMDEGKKDIAGCSPNCTVLIQDQQFVVARNDAIYCYTTDGKGPCYALGGIKKRVDWFRSYLVTISKENEPREPSTFNDNTSNSDHVTILDIQNRFIVFSMPLDEVKAVSTEWGAFYIITQDKKVYHLDEKDVQSKLSLLFKKNSYDIAIKLATSQKYDSDRLIDIYTQYGDHLFKKGDPKGAIDQYVKTIGRLETCYVIRKYLESRHLEPLTFYLQELHKLGLATEDHTTLLLTCFVKLDQHEKLKAFINANDRTIDFDVEIAIKVCRKVSSDDALYLAEKHQKHDWYLRIMTEDKNDFISALEYIGTLEFENANFFMKKYGHIFMQNIPAETTQFLKILCVNYKPKNAIIVDKGERAQPEEFIHLFLKNSKRLVEFIEFLIESEGKWSTMIYNTLIEHHLHIWSGLNDDSSTREVYEDMIIQILQNPEANYDKDQTLNVCLMLNFKPGILYLYEEYKLYHQILRYHIAQKDMDSAMNCCRKFGIQEPHLWVEMLWCPPSSEHLPEVLNVIANQRLLSPLLVIDCLANGSKCTLQDVRKYVMNILSSENEISLREATEGERLRSEAEKGRAELLEASIRPLVCQVSRCAACSRALELPSRHFLCNHSYHQHCVQSYSESEDVCPACVPNNKKLTEVLQNQGTTAKDTEEFHSQLGKANDGFSVVAKYFGKSIFNKLIVIGNEETQDQNSIALKKDAIISNINVQKPIKKEVINQPISEGRLRLEEGISKQIIAPVDTSKMYTPKSSIIVPIPEARIRLMEQKTQESQYSSSLGTSVKNYSDHMVNKYDNADRESSKNSALLKNSPASLKNRKVATHNDNVSVGSNSSSHRETKSIKASLNPFESDDIPSESRNPFEDDEDDTIDQEVQSKKNIQAKVDKKNPFEDDSD